MPACSRERPAGTRGAGMTNNRNRYSAATFLGCTAAL